MADADASRAGSPFPNTRWTLIEEVRGGGAGGERALAELCAIYWYPVYAYARRGGAAPPDAEDIAQGFFAHLLARGDLAGAEAARGRLRSFLLAALKHYIIDLHRKQSAQKRGGGATFIPIDAGDAEERYQEEPADLSDPEKLFERRWALALLDDAFARLEREYAASGKADLYHAIRPYLAGASKRHRYADAGAALGMSEGAFQVAVHRLKKRYRRALEDAIAETVASPAEVEGELRYVMAALAG